MVNSNNKEHNTWIIDNKETTSDLKNDALNLMERILHPKYPPIIRCILAKCKHFVECWGAGAKWKEGILGCKAPSKLEETHEKNEYVSFSKASKIIYINRHQKDLIIEALHDFIKFLPMYKTSIEELIKTVEDCEILYGIG